MADPTGFQTQLVEDDRPDKLNLMGDDGEGNCWGCGEPLDRINVDCPVCLQALDHC